MTKHVGLREGGLSPKSDVHYISHKSQASHIRCKMFTVPVVFGQLSDVYLRVLSFH